MEISFICYIIPLFLREALKIFEQLLESDLDHSYKTGIEDPD